MNAANSPSWLQVPVSTTMIASASRYSSPGARNRSIGVWTVFANSYRGPRSLATATRTDLSSCRSAQARPTSDPRASPSGRTWVMIRNFWCDRMKFTNGDQSIGMDGDAFRLLCPRHRKSRKTHDQSIGMDGGAFRVGVLPIILATDPPEYRRPNPVESRHVETPCSDSPSVIWRRLDGRGPSQCADRHH